MTSPSRTWRPRADVAWIGDENRVIAAGTSPADGDGPRILEGVTALVWVGLADPRSRARIADSADHSMLIESAIEALAAAGLIEGS